METKIVSVFGVSIFDQYVFWFYLTFQKVNFLFKQLFLICQQKASEGPCNNYLLQSVKTLLVEEKPLIRGKVICLSFGYEGLLTAIKVNYILVFKKEVRKESMQ